MADPTEILSADEQAQLDEFMRTDQSVPDADEQEGAPAAPAPPGAAPDPTPAAPAPAARAEPPAPAAEPPTPASDPAPGPAPTDEERFAAWQAQHAGKSPEEMARLAFQQSQRASGAEARARTASQSLTQINDRVRGAAERAAAERARVQTARTEFDQRLTDDPDAATRELRDQRDRDELARIDREEFEARRGAAVDLATQAMPDFAERAPAIYSFGGEMGYSQDELAGVSDGRDLVVLGLAEKFARGVKAGLWDLNGTPLAQAPQAVATAPTDPRLTAPAPAPTLSSAPARAAAPATNLAKQATDLLAMSEADFDKFAAENPAEFEAMMKQLGS